MRTETQSFIPACNTQSGGSKTILAKSQTNNKLNAFFPVCRSLVGEEAWGNIVQNLASESDDPDVLIRKLWDANESSAFPDYLPTVAWVEHLREKVRESRNAPPTHVDDFVLNPTLELVKSEWGVAACFEEEGASTVPRRGEEWVLIWLDPETLEPRVKAATQGDLFVVKTLAEDLSVKQSAEAAGVFEQKVYQTLHRASANGLVLAPSSKITRADTFSTHDPPEGFASTSAFVVQWHITHACDLHCKHCYDRSKRSPLTMDQGVQFLDDLGAFCREKNVRGHVCFSGGNPFLHANFTELYQTAADRGFATSILGNPVSRDQIKRICDIQYPLFYQVSLEGLPQHNDSIRGTGTFTDVLEFLGALRDFGVESTVMLTLTKDNLDQVIPLGQRLSGHADNFTFNRLAAVGEGANLCLPDKETYRQFLDDYLAAMASNSVFTLKDNLLNLAKSENGDPMFDGCTGFGCGAAFNFVAVLPDGEVHACRKFPSSIGNIYETDLRTVYDSDTADRYRQGTGACTQCSLKYRCGGCMAVVHATGGNVFEDRDPLCFIN